MPKFQFFRRRDTSLVRAVMTFKCFAVVFRVEREMIDKVQRAYWIGELWVTHDDTSPAFEKRMPVELITLGLDAEIEAAFKLDPERAMIDWHNKILRDQFSITRS